MQTTRSTRERLPVGGNRSLSTSGTDLKDFGIGKPPADHGTQHIPARHPDHQIVEGRHAVDRPGSQHTRSNDVPVRPDTDSDQTEADREAAPELARSVQHRDAHRFLDAAGSVITRF